MRVTKRQGRWAKETVSIACAPSTPVIRDRIYVGDYGVTGGKD
jgi:hypothetical protein